MFGTDSSENESGGYSDGLRRRHVALGALSVVLLGAITSFIGALRENEDLTETLAEEGHYVDAGKKGIHLKRKFKSKVSLVKLKKADVELSVVEVQRERARGDEPEAKNTERDGESYLPDSPPGEAERTETGTLVEAERTETDETER